MPVFFDNKRLFTDNGIPYMWQSGDVTTTPSNEVKILPSDGVQNDQFGFKVAVGCGKIVVSAYNYGTLGEVYTYDLDGTNETTITASDAASGDNFGRSVAVGGGKIVIGASGDNSNRGAVYTYDLDGTNETKITASDGAASDYFGNSVAVGCGKIVVGAYNDDENAGTNTGSVYTYDLDGTNETKITASDLPTSFDLFGFSVAVGCGKIVVGAYQDDDNGNSSGSAYIYDLDGSNEIKITASDGAAADYFGTSVAVGCGKIVVGSYYDDDNGGNSGSAYIYDLDGTNEVKITASDGSTNDIFGLSLAVGCGRIVVAARGVDIGSNVNQGSIYIFDLDGNQLGITTASDGADEDQFGWSVAIGSGKIVVGAVGVDDGSELGVGAAYIYDTPLVYTLYDAIDLNYG